MKETHASRESRPRVTSRKPGLACLLAFQLASALSAGAALESGIYRTTVGATAEEVGDRVPSSSRIIPLSATFLFDLDGAEPVLTAVLSDAVLEGGSPFVLTVRSEFGSRLPDGTYVFRGDYLADIEPDGTQYGFDWRFSTTPDGQLVWNGVIGWFGGHIWQITISDIILVPDPSLFQLEISRVDSKITLSWHSILAAYRPEQSTSLLLTDWHPVTTPVEAVGDRLSVTLDIDATRTFFRLRKL